jgi:hypothetical protein
LNDLPFLTHADCIVQSKKVTEEQFSETTVKRLHCKCRVSENPIQMFHVWKRYFAVLCENSQLARRRGEKGKELPPNNGWWQFPALPSSPAVELRSFSFITEPIA